VLAAGAVVLGFPLGLALFRAAIAADGGGAYAFPAWWSVAVVAPAAIAAVVLLALPLSRRAASIRVADALRYE
jgi:ABC-type antimicrobial peptide transport system permease subunit